MSNVILSPISGSDCANATKRRSGKATVAVHTTQGSCDTLDIRDFSGIAVLPPTGVTSLTFYGCDTANGTFVLINDLGTNGVVTVTANVWQTIGAAIFPHAFIQMKSAGATGNATVIGKT